MPRRRTQVPLMLTLGDILNKRCRARVELREDASPAARALARWRVREGKEPPSLLHRWLIWEEREEEVRLGPDFWRKVAALASACVGQGEELLAEKLAAFWNDCGALFRVEGNRLPLSVVGMRLTLFGFWCIWCEETLLHEKTRGPQAGLIDQFLLEPLRWAEERRLEPGAPGPLPLEWVWSFRDPDWPRIPSPPSAFNDRDEMIRWVRNQVLRPNVSRLLSWGLSVEWRLTRSGLIMFVQPRDPYVLALLQAVSNLLTDAPRPTHACPCGCGRNVSDHKKYFNRNCMRRGNVKRAVLQRYYTRRRAGTITTEEYAAVKRALNAAKEEFGTRPAEPEEKDALEERFEAAAQRAISRLRKANKTKGVKSE